MCLLREGTENIKLDFFQAIPAAPSCKYKSRHVRMLGSEKRRVMGCEIFGYIPRN
jgi:hypothetical protein